jgi:hypothetical protein
MRIAQAWVWSVVRHVAVLVDAIRVSNVEKSSRASLRLSSLGRQRYMATGTSQEKGIRQTYSLFKDPARRAGKEKHWVIGDLPGLGAATRCLGDIGPRKHLSPLLTEQCPTWGGL